ncbi:PhoX family protein [Parachitinimonas caeni]|uniref:PhoX family phosphatase n=1 Tax=Parachitinimonas caeni TaxID=3031301 RepID=A0ABT7E4F1_9NEIS|nr:PhoX family phosphatase [Parachitinimonas caeni]MDK2126939.1 PhoX family phosphatase [Parachitinimonas caeni]
MNQPLHTLDPDDIGHNDSANPSFDAVLDARLSRRGILRGGLGGAASVLLGGFGLAGCSSSDSTPTGGGAGTGGGTGNPGSGGATTPARFNFNPVAKSLADALVLPAGYSASVIYAVGDPLKAGLAAYRNDGSDVDFDWRAGDHHDGMEYFGLTVGGNARDDNGSERGLLVMNHENLTTVFLHPKGVTSSNGVRVNKAEVDREVAAHGVSVVEIRKQAGRFQTEQASPFNRRITPLTPVGIAGPVRGSALVKTVYSKDGTGARGTLNNCATGRTPWGTFLTCEENWAGYFARIKGDDARRSAREVVALKRYGLNEGSSGSYAWASAGTEDAYRRWDLGRSGISADGSDDYRNEANTFGYVLELDPYNPSALPQKRTALGRFAHECAVCPKPVVGKPVVFYMGDDSRNEYIYKFVSKAVWDAADAHRGMAAGDKYLNEGTLYVARFNADGSGEWLPLSLSNPKVAGYAGYLFADQADVLVNVRLAADAAGATKMDRPEWCAVNPKNNEVYFTLTNNSNRVLAGASGSKILPDAANPRAYEDNFTGSSATSKGNVNGHILRTRENGDDPAAGGFKWDIYLFAAEAGAPASVNLSALTADNDMSSPDGIAFTRNGLLWIQTDDGAYTDVTNCMLLAALPGQVGDGGPATVANKLGNDSLEVATQKGKNPTADNLRRFLVGPKGCEITGITETPDGRTLFINIQHPGEDTRAADLADPAKWQSHWPHGGNQRPRSATVVITKDDGGTIGI